MSEDILYAVQDGIAQVTFNRPQARNAFTFAMYERLAELCDAVEADSAIRVLVLTGAGDRAFASGTDIAQFREFRTPQDAIGYEQRIERVVSRLEALGKPTIAAIAGACTGGGAALAAVCDLRVASADARFGFPIARTLGNCLAMANYARLAGLLGASRVKEMIFTARLMGAAEAQSAGLFHEVLDTPDAMRTRAADLARIVAGHAPITLKVTKEALRRLRPPAAEGEDLILAAYMSEDFREGLDAFLNKRTPQW
ncbi:MAG TPA: enoyl-CoA hydratase/isomerase family protein, partial [Acetobacteraceae bacterium]